MGFLLKRILLPIILAFVIVALSALLIPAEYAALRLLPAIVFIFAVIYWWLTGMARFVVRRWHWTTVGYLLVNLAIALALGGFFVVGIVINQVNSTLGAVFGLFGLFAGPGWLIWSIVHLLRGGKQRRSKGRLWRLLTGWLEQPSAQSPATKQPPAKSQPSAQQRSTPARATAPRSSAPRMVANDAGDFVHQAQDWVLRQEYVGTYTPFAANLPSYRKMSFEQQQWYFYWRTQLRLGKPLATDFSYLQVYTYELLNLVGVKSPQEGRQRLVAFWSAYRVLQPKLDSTMVDWVADFNILNHLPESPLSWYANVLPAGVTSSRALQWEAWHQQGRDYAVLPPSTLFDLAGYATQQNKFYQAFQSELALGDALKHGVEVIDGYVQQTQQKSLYELHLPTATQSVIRPPLAGALHTYPTTPIVIGHVRPWLSDDALKADLRAILRYTENILRTQAAFKTKLRGITLSPAWAAALDQAFVKALPKRVVSIDMAGAAALQRESDELRQRLLQAGETPLAQGAPTASIPPQPPLPVIENPIAALPPTNAAIQRPVATPAGLLTDLAAVAAIMQNGASEASQLLNSLRAQQWQGKPATLKIGGNNSFSSLLFDRINERAIAELGDELLFMEKDEWVVGEDYRDEIAYLLDNPDFAAKLIPLSPDNAATVSIGVGAASSTETANEPPAEASIEASGSAQPDLIPSGWENCVVQMQPLSWATLQVVLEQEAGAELMAKLDALARTHAVTANQLLDQLNEIGLATVGDNLIDVATTPPQVIDEYKDPLNLLLQWAKDHNQIEGLP